VGFGGHSLSVGQRQRIAIARVVLADRPILLFDEATSALDHETEASVQRALRDVTANRTTIIVAHRLSTIRHADHIYVLDEGEIRESGRHDDLIAADGIYASLWRVQTGEALGERRSGRHRKPSVH
jgi:ATP-binding cassette subfamily B protein